MGLLKKLPMSTRVEPPVINTLADLRALTKPWRVNPGSNPPTMTILETDLIGLQEALERELAPLDGEACGICDGTGVRKP